MLICFTDCFFFAIMNMYPISVQILTWYVENLMFFVVLDDEKCCVCKLFTPEEVRESPCLIFTKWLHCDQCKHWVHLIYSTEKRVIRKGDVFLWDCFFFAIMNMYPISVQILTWYVENLMFFVVFVINLMIKTRKHNKV
jgi:hypothetical protein